jgi:hypothetical protein
MTQGAIDLVQAELGQARVLKYSLQKKIDVVQKVETSEDCSRNLPLPTLLVSDSDSDAAQQSEEFSNSKVDQTTVDLLHLVPCEGPPDLNTIRKYIRRNRN